MHEYDNQNHTGNSSFVPNKSDVCISNSLFHDCTSSSNGGAVSSSSTSVNRMFIEDTTFTTCKTTSYYGGWIFFQNTNNGECVIFHTCGFDCSSKYSGSSSSTLGQYAFIQTKSNDDTYKNEVNESTMTGITKESAYPYYALRLYYSNIVCSSVNITNNECYYYPALGCYPTIKTDVVTCLIMYTSIVNNTAKEGYGCIVLSNSGSTQTISTSNIINNKQDDSSSVATILTNGNLCINESCIIGNNEGNKVFYEGSSSYQIKIINCTLDSENNSKYQHYLRVRSYRPFSSQLFFIFFLHNSPERDLCNEIFLIMWLTMLHQSNAIYFRPQIWFLVFWEKSYKNSKNHHFPCFLDFDFI